MMGRSVVCRSTRIAEKDEEAEVAAPEETAADLSFEELTEGADETAEAESPALAGEEISDVKPEE